MKKIKQNLLERSICLLGYQNDHKARYIQFINFKRVRDDSTCYLMIDKPVEKMIPLDDDNGFVVEFNITKKELYKPYTTKAQILEIKDDEMISHSGVFMVQLLPSLNDSEQIEEITPDAEYFYSGMKDWFIDIQERVSRGEFKGEKGDKGDTPIKGVDYFTEEDKKELIEEMKFSYAPVHTVYENGVYNIYDEKNVKQTFTSLKALFDDVNVFLYCVHSNVIHIPSFIEDEGAVSFSGAYTIGDNSHISRVIINTQNVVHCNDCHVEDTTNKVTSTRMSEATLQSVTKYPSMKVLVDYVASHGGGYDDTEVKQRISNVENTTSLHSLELETQANDIDNLEIALGNKQDKNVYIQYLQDVNAQSIVESAMSGINYYVVDMENYTYALMDRVDMANYLLFFESEKATYTISLIDNSWNKIEKTIPTDAHINNLIDAKITGLETLANEIEGVIG